MGKILILILLFVVTIFASDVKWAKDYNDGISIAKKQNKPMLVYFTGSDWCKPCVKLKKDFFNLSF